jgi:hypothetical protein
MQRQNRIIQNKFKASKVIASGAPQCNIAVHPDWRLRRTSVGYWQD